MINKQTHSTRMNSLAVTQKLNYRDRWKELVNEGAKELSDSLVRTFKDESTMYRFSVNQVDPLVYAFMPPIIDYTLFVDIERTDRESDQVEKFRDVSLGSYCNSRPRKLLDFGEQYFDATYKTLIKIVGKQFKSEKRFERRHE